MDSDKNGNIDTVHTNFGESMSKGATKADWRSALGRRIEEDETAPIGSNPERIAFYDEHADTYTEDHLAMDYNGPHKCAQIAHKYLKGRTDESILDVGCGTGMVLKELHKLAPYNNVHGLDPSSSMLARAQREDPYQKIYTKYFKVGTGLEHNSYDAVICCGAFIPGHLRAECIIEMYDLVKPGGYIVNVMRGLLLDVDPNFKQIKPMVKQMEQEGKVEVLEDYMFERYFAFHDGHVFVLRKIK